MPKTSMHKNHFFLGPEHEIRIPRQVFCMKPETVSKPMHQ